MGREHESKKEKRKKPLKTAKDRKREKQERKVLTKNPQRFIISGSLPDNE